MAVNRKVRADQFLPWFNLAILLLIELDARWWLGFGGQVVVPTSGKRE